MMCRTPTRARNSKHFFDAVLNTQCGFEDSHESLSQTACTCRVVSIVVYEVHSKNRQVSLTLAEKTTTRNKKDRIPQEGLKQRTEHL